MPQSKRSRIRAQSKKVSKPSVKNNKTRKKVMIQKTRFDYKNIQKQLDAQVEIRLLIQLLANGSKKAVKLANSYSEKTGIEVDESMLNNKISKLPTLKNTVSKIQSSYNAPPSTTALGWVW